MQLKAILRFFEVKVDDEDESAKSHVARLRHRMDMMAQNEFIDFYREVLDVPTVVVIGAISKYKEEIFALERQDRAQCDSQSFTGKPD